MNLISKLFGMRKTSRLPADHVRLSGNWIALPDAVRLIRNCSSAGELVEYIQHYSGYLREAAIGRAVEVPDAEFLLPVAGRLNDWVPEVREAARSAMLTFLAMLSVKDFLPVLPQLLALRSATRTDHSDWLERFERAFLEKADLDLLRIAVQQNEYGISRACYSLALRYDAMDIDELIDLGLHSKDVVLAVWSVQLCEKLFGSTRLLKLHEATHSPFGTVRATALRSLLSLGSMESQRSQREVAFSFLLDGQGAVRDIAMQWLKDAGIDVRSQYLNALLGEQASPETLRICLLALSRCGTSSDVEMIKTFVTSLSPSVRAAAFLGWVKLTPESKDLVADRVLADESPRVQKLAVFLMHRLGAYIPFERVMALAISGQSHRLALRLSMSDKWNWLECIVQIGLNAKDDAELLTVLAGHLDRWLRDEGKSYSAPTAQQVSMLSDKRSTDTLQTLCGKNWLALQIILRMQFPQ